MFFELCGVNVFVLLVFCLFGCVCVVVSCVCVNVFILVFFFNGLSLRCCGCSLLLFVVLCVRVFVDVCCVCVFVCFCVFCVPVCLCACVLV